jgi:chorismate-pyruvate lyase
MCRPRWGSAALLILVATLTSCACLPATRVARIEALALLQTLNADLLSHDSATLTLERWCADHSLADPPRIVARRMRETVKHIPEDLRERLAVDAAEPIAHRHVQLMCGIHVLSEADNWYVPGRLTAEMNHRLENSDEPFGKVVQALGFQRRTLSKQLLWSPLPQGWEMSAANVDHAPLRVPHSVLRHQAILYTSTHVPFSAVAETYTNQLLDFGAWKRYLTVDD